MELNVLLVNAIAIAAMVGGVLIGGWWLIGLYAVRTRENEKELEEVELPSNLHEVFAGIPPAVWVFIAFIFLSGIGYVLWIWLAEVTY